MSKISLEHAMTTAALEPRSELQKLLRRIAGPEGSVKERVRKAARKLNWNYSRTEDLWYESRRATVRAQELDEARKAARESIGADLHEIEALKARIESLEATVRSLLAR